MKLPILLDSMLPGISTVTAQARIPLGARRAALKVEGTAILNAAPNVPQSSSLSRNKTSSAPVSIISCPPAAAANSRCSIPQNRAEPSTRSSPRVEHWNHTGQNREVLMRGKCAGCEWFDICGGGFRTRAAFANGDLWGSGPACYLSEEENNAALTC